MLSNRKAEHRKGKVQLIDATKLFRPLRRNLGKRNCEMTAEHIQAVLDAYEAIEPSETSIVLPNSSFGYWKIVVERPLRLRSRFTREAIEALRFQSGHRALREALHAEFGDGLFDDFASVADRLKAYLDPPEPELEEEDRSGSRHPLPVRGASREDRCERPGAECVAEQRQPERADRA